MSAWWPDRPISLAAKARSRAGLRFAAAACLVAWGASEILIRPEVRAAYGVAFAPGGDRVAALSVTLGEAKGLLRIWDVATGRPIASAVTPDRPLCLAFAPDGKSVATGEWGGGVTSYDPVNGRKLRVYSGLSTPVRGLAFTPDGRKIVAGAAQGLIIVWDAETGREQRRFDRGPFLPVNSLAVSPDGRLLAAAGGLRPGSTNLWDLETGRPLTLATLNAVREPVAFGPGHELLALNPAGPVQAVQRIDLDGDRVLSAVPTSMTRSLGVSRNGRFLANGGDDELVAVSEMATGRRVATYEEHRSPDRRDAIPEGLRSLLGSMGLAEVRTQNTVWSVAISDDGRRVASVSQDGSAWLRELPGVASGGQGARALLSPPDRPAWARALRFALPLSAALLLAGSIFRGRPRPLQSRDPGRSADDVGPEIA